MKHLFLIVLLLFVLVFALRRPPQYNRWRHHVKEKTIVPARIPRGFSGFAPDKGDFKPYDEDKDLQSSLSADVFWPIGATMAPIDPNQQLGDVGLSSEHARKLIAELSSKLAAVTSAPTTTTTLMPTPTMPPPGLNATIQGMPAPPPGTTGAPTIFLNPQQAAVNANDPDELDRLIRELSSRRAALTTSNPSFSSTSTPYSTLTTFDPTSSMTTFGPSSSPTAVGSMYL